MATVTQYILDTKKLYLDLMEEACTGVNAEWGGEFDRITDQKISESDFVKTFNVDPTDVLCFPEDAPVNIFNRIYESGKYDEYWHEGKVVTVKEPTATHFKYKGKTYNIDEVSLADRLIWLMEDCRCCEHSLYSFIEYNSVWVVEENGIKTVLPLTEGYPPCYLWVEGMEFPINYPQNNFCDDIEWD